MVRLDIHADDFGESLHTSEDMIACMKAGCLDSISVLSNMSCFAQCVKRYREEQGSFKKTPKISVHLNVMDGRCLSEPGKIPDLADEEGHFKISWMQLFFRSYLPGRKRLRRQLKEEIRRQIEAVWHAFPEMEKLRIDSHQHTHMIPVAADALLELISEKGWQAEYIRDAREPIGPFLKELPLYYTYRPVNFVKNLILNYCSRCLSGKWKEMGLEPMYLWGLVMSGHMDRERVARLLPAMRRKAEKDRRTLEILFHPGQALPDEIGEEFGQKEAIPFYLSEDRKTEREAVLFLNGLKE